MGICVGPPAVLAMGDCVFGDFDFDSRVTSADLLSLQAAVSPTIATCTPIRDWSNLIVRGYAGVQSRDPVGGFSGDIQGLCSFIDLKFGRICRNNSAPAVSASYIGLSWEDTRSITLPGDLTLAQDLANAQIGSEIGRNLMDATEWVAPPVATYFEVDVKPIQVPVAVGVETPPGVIGYSPAPSPVAETPLDKAAETAKQQARFYLGGLLVDNSSTHPSAKFAKARSHHCVFLPDDAEYWSVHFERAELMLPASDGTRDRANMNVEVVLDSNFSPLVTIIWNPEQGDPLKSVPSAVSLRNQLAHIEEDWCSPVSRPGLRLAEALRAVVVRLAEAPNDTLRAMISVQRIPTSGTIVAYCVDAERAYSSRGSIWSIDFRDITPHRNPGRYGGGPAAAAAFSHLRHVVDAQSGEWLFADSIPQPGEIAPPSRRLTPEQKNVRGLINAHRDVLDKHSERPEGSSREEKQP